MAIARTLFIAPSMMFEPRGVPKPRLTSAAVDDKAKKTLESTTRYDPSEVERRIFERWDEGGLLPS